MEAELPSEHEGSAHGELFVPGKVFLALEVGVRWEKVEVLADQEVEVVEGQKVIGVVM